MIDLHAHTTHSDGQRSPEELLAEAAQAGLTVLALTDHDTVSGIPDARAAAARHGLRLVPGIEISAELHGREVHVLGHLIDDGSPLFRTLAPGLLDERRERMEKMVHRARSHGLLITIDQVVEMSGGENLGRPHLARALVKQGYAESVKEAFDKFLHDKGLLYVDRSRMAARDAIAVIHRAGGTASLAHPGANKVSEQELRVLADAGLDAVEALHPEHVPTQAEAYQRWATGLGMLITAGSDFHGPAIRKERRLGDRTLAAEQFAALEERAAGWRA